MTEDYRVQLDMYNGPLDLLLYLIRREEVDIYDIPIVKITEQYVGYVELLREIDPNAAGEFLVLAATLMEIKSRTLLPRPPAESEEEFIDPRLELVRQLLEYKKFKDAAEQLRDAADERARRFARQPSDGGAADESEVEIDSLAMWDLVEAFREVMAKTGRLTPHEIQYDDTPIALHAVDVADRLQREGGSMAFVEIFEGRTRSECIGLFLALLELVRQRRVRVEQEMAFGPIIIHLLDATPIEEPVEADSVFVSSPAGPDEAGPSDRAAQGEPTTPAVASEHHTDEGPVSMDEASDEEKLGDLPDVPEISTLSSDPAGTEIAADSRPDHPADTKPAAPDPKIPPRATPEPPTGEAGAPPRDIDH
jgi:segregation and condensation protein A